MTFLVAHAWTIVLTCNAAVSSIWAIWVTRSIRALKKEMQSERRLAMLAAAYAAEEKMIH